ncbi:DMT family transporter [Aristophania vespae]|uniref:DMT family transporter n=1 Tax=Aristophania vespae TaxID=2697033 RepID=UPI001F367D42|nr:DMT family transporter [Aristophania vespae]
MERALKSPEQRFLPLYILVSIVSWASAYPVVRLAMRDIPPIPLASLRYMLAATLGLLWLAWKRPALPSLRDCPRLVLSGILGITLYNIFFNLGEQSVSSGVTSLIIASAPIMAGLMAVAFTKETLSLFGWLGSLLGFGGIALIVSGQKGDSL